MGRRKKKKRAFPSLPSSHKQTSRERFESALNQFRAENSIKAKTELRNQPAAMVVSNVFVCQKGSLARSTIRASASMTRSYNTRGGLGPRSSVLVAKSSNPLEAPPRLLLDQEGRQGLE